MLGDRFQHRGVMWLVLLVTLGAFALASCSDDDDSGSGDDTETGDDSTDGETGESSDGEDDSAADNACPADGCTLSISEFNADEGGEVLVTFDANFAPDFSANHIHIYWDTYTADQVSADAADRGVEQGAWVATDEFPTYLTEADVSIEARDGSTTLCVTAADGDHNVIDSSVFECVDVSGAL